MNFTPESVSVCSGSNNEEYPSGKEINRRDWMRSAIVSSTMAVLGISGCCGREKEKLPSKVAVKSQEPDREEKVEKVEQVIKQSIYYPQCPELPRGRDRRNEFLISQEEAMKRYDAERSKYSYYRDYLFANGARSAKYSFDKEHNEDFFRGTYFIVDTGLAHSIAVGTWLMNHNIDTAVVLSDSPKVSTKERTKVLLGHLNDEIPVPNKRTVGLATLLDVHRADPILDNTAENDVRVSDFLPQEHFGSNGINKVIVLTERSLGSHKIEATRGSLEKYLLNLRRDNIDVHVYGIDLFRTAGGYPRDWFDKVTFKELVDYFQKD